MTIAGGDPTPGLTRPAERSKPRAASREGIAEGAGLAGLPRDIKGQGYRHGMSAGLTTDGILVSPIRYRFTAVAQLRPSAIAQTMRDWPRPMSPATNTPSTFVDQFRSLATAPRA